VLGRDDGLLTSEAEGDVGSDDVPGHASRLGRTGDTEGRLTDRSRPHDLVVALQ
jgi:hypothetical protein